MTNDLFNALLFAKQAHSGQKRKYKDEPYVNHPIRVMSLVATLDSNYESQLIAALLHDTLEDTKTDYSDLCQDFGLDVFDLVLELTNVYTKENYPDLNRKERQKKEHERLSEISFAAKEIKLADRLDNLNDLHLCPDIGFVRLYMQETLELLKYLNMPEHMFTKQIENIINTTLLQKVTEF